ncbi:Vacuolar fusion protein mon1 [Umbelopsis sp. WA50703]
MHCNLKPVIIRKTTPEEAAGHFVDQIKGKSVLVTNTIWGVLGAEAIRIIAKNSAALVIVAVRRQDRLDETADKVKGEISNANLRSFTPDLTSLDFVSQTAKEVNTCSEIIDILIDMPLSWHQPIW